VLEVLEVLKNQDQIDDSKGHGIEHFNHSVVFNNSNKSYLFKCYYCDKFVPTSTEKEYLKHVVVSHNNKPAYPSLVDIEKNKSNP
jgi:hypothetical protein